MTDSASLILFHPQSLSPCHLTCFLRAVLCVVCLPCTAAQPQQGKSFWHFRFTPKATGRRDGGFDLPGHKTWCLTQLFSPLLLCLQQNHFTFQSERRAQFQTKWTFVCRNFAYSTGSRAAISCHHHTCSESAGGHFYFLSWHSSPLAEG